MNSDMRKRGSRLTKKPKSPLRDLRIKATPGKLAKALFGGAKRRKGTQRQAKKT